MNDNELRKIITDSMYETVNKIFDERIRKLYFNYCVEGKVTQCNLDGTYDMSINGSDSIQTVYTMNDNVYKRDDIVYVLVINNRYQNKYILCKKDLIIL